MVRSRDSVRPRPGASASTVSATASRASATAPAAPAVKVKLSTPLTPLVLERLRGARPSVVTDVRRPSAASEVTGWPSTPPRYSRWPASPAVRSAAGSGSPAIRYRLGISG